MAQRHVFESRFGPQTIQVLGPQRHDDSRRAVNYCAAARATEKLC